MALNLQHQTPSEFAARFWNKVQNAYSSGDKLTYHRLIWWIWNKVQLGELTNDQVRISFNTAFNRSLNITQWNNFVQTRLIPIKDRYLAILAEEEL